MRYQLSVNLRDCYLSRRATQNMSQFPHHWYERTWVTAISSRCLAALPATLSAFSSYITCGKTATIVTWSEPLEMPCSCDATKRNSKTIRSRLSQSAFAAKGANQVTCNLMAALYQNSKCIDFCAVWVSYRQTNCHCKN